MRASVCSPSKRATVSVTRSDVFEAARDLDQQFVARGVAQAVVDDLEAIDVEEQHREDRVPGLLMTRENPVEPLHEEHAVRQSGQRVGAARGDLRADARQRDREVDGLRDVVVRAQIERFDDVFAPVLGRDHDHRQIGDRPHLAQPAERFDAAHARHHDVEQYGVDPAFADDLKRVRAVLRGHDGVAVAGQPARQRVAIHRVVVDQQKRCVRL